MVLWEGRKTLTIIQRRTDETIIFSAIEKNSQGTHLSRLRSTFPCKSYGIPSKFLYNQNALIFSKSVSVNKLFITIKGTTKPICPSQVDLVVF
jgi:hypothetical protein